MDKPDSLCRALKTILKVFVKNEISPKFGQANCSKPSIIMKKKEGLTHSTVFWNLTFKLYSDLCLEPKKYDLAYDTLHTSCKIFIRKNGHFQIMIVIKLKENLI